MGELLVTIGVLGVGFTTATVVAADYCYYSFLGKESAEARLQEFLGKR